MAAIILTFFIFFASRYALTVANKEIGGGYEVAHPWYESKAGLLSTLKANTQAHCALHCWQFESESCQSMQWHAASKECRVSDNWYRQFPQSDQVANVYRKLARPRCPYLSYLRQVGNRNFCVIQQRIRGSVNFSRNWTEYEEGFGDAFDFWTGLKSIHALTNKPSGVLLRVEMTDFANGSYHSEYSGFIVSDNNDKYRMDFNQYLSADSTAGNPLNHNRGMQFSTFDNDNDMYTGTESCSSQRENTGWWYNICTYGNPNGPYSATKVVSSRMIIWHTLHDNFENLKNIRMMLQVD